jgi:hypothetical protein
MDRVLIRSTAFSFAFACGAMVVGPGVVGIAQSHAILGIGPDLFDLFEDDDKSAMHHPRPGTEEFTAKAARTVGIETADAGPPVSAFGSVPESVSRVGAGGGVPESAGRGGGGGAVPRSTVAGRSSNLQAVPSAPITRNIVIRGAPSAASPAGTPIQEFVPPALRQGTGGVPFAAPPPGPPVPEGRPAPAGPPAPAPAPRTKNPLAPNNSGAGRIPDSFRVGYAEHLRAATTTDLFVAALPGVAGIAGFTIIGAYAGYRQAKAVQAALLPAVPTRILL